MQQRFYILIGLFFQTVNVIGDDVWLEDLCISYSQDGTTNEYSSLSQEQCEYYDTFRNNETTILLINLEETISGCWLFNDTQLYFNSATSASGMCSSPHYCVREAVCGNVGVQQIYSIEKNNESGIGLNKDSGSTALNVALTEPEYPKYTILLVVTLILITFLIIAGYVSIRTNPLNKTSYRV